MDEREIPAINRRLVEIRKALGYALMKCRRGGLRLKLSFYTAALVLLVALMISAPLYIMMTRFQEDTLLRGLWNRCATLLDGMTVSARVFLPAGDLLNLEYLPVQSAVIPEAKYLTITGYGPGDTVHNDYVWATNDPNILEKIDTPEFVPGVSRITDELTAPLEALGEELNRKAGEGVERLSPIIASLKEEAASLAPGDSRLEDIDLSIKSLEDSLAEILAEAGRRMYSEPAYPASGLNAAASRNYLLYKPVMFIAEGEQACFRGLLRMEISLDSIFRIMAERRRSIFQVILIVALAALAIGDLGAVLLAALIINPIRQLVSHVERIRDTENKADLAGQDINIKSHDELEALGDTINGMTRGLVKAALAASELSIGKEVQKKFIPLEMDKEGNKLSCGFKETKNVEFFGYYEGAAGVSGDYFDYKDLDGRYAAIIKCDVAGKGVPAALIMIQVATMFLNHFKQWRPAETGMHIEKLVYQINGFIETLGFTGRFAAFTLCLLDSETGLLRFCNAGDNRIHLYDAAARRMKTVIFPETPAAGALPNNIVESRGGYQVETLAMNRGDILFLYTDGIEEAKRGKEEMGRERVEAVINAAMNREVYTLRHGGEALDFDFSRSPGRVEDAVLALVAVEKIFRCYRKPGQGDEARVLVDRKVDAYLKEHFLQYETYCGHARDAPGNRAYRYYTGVREEDQYDDLTILGIKRK